MAGGVYNMWMANALKIMDGQCFENMRRPMLLILAEHSRQTLLVLEAFLYTIAEDCDCANCADDQEARISTRFAPFADLTHDMLKGSNFL